MGTAKKVVGFGKMDQWEPAIRAGLDTERYECEFINLRMMDISFYDLVVPLRIGDHDSLVEQADAAVGRALYPTPSVAALCHDKYRFNKYLSETEFGWAIPKMFEDEPPTIPFVVKKREDAYGAHTYLVKTEEDLASVADMVRKPAYFSQVYIAGGQEYTTHILIKDGIPVFNMNVTYDMKGEYYVKNNKTQAQKIVIDYEKKELDLFVRMLAVLGYENGTCCFNYKYVDDKPMIFEVNPRYGGSLTQDINGYLDAYERALA